MCGIAGLLPKRDAMSSADAVAAVARMTDQMRLRGPDAAGEWNDGVAFLGHRRLSIIDLDPRANQPFVSACGRYHAVFNGEIYNYAELRAGLLASGATLRTSSDTEVMVELIARRGVSGLALLRGMYAIAVWDSLERRLLLARDPYGIKPLYVAETPSGVAFASQVKALLRSGLLHGDTDPDSRLWFWLTGSVPEPRTWFKGVTALPPGSYAWVSERGVAPPFVYWDIADDYRCAAAVRGRAVDARGRFRAAVSRSVEAHLVSDVPVAVLLSGGIDSGVIAALAVEHSGARAVSGITIAFDEFAGTPRDESPDSAVMARHLGIAHHVRHVSQREFEGFLPRVLEAMDQPSIDGINTWLATMAAAEQGLKVVLSGVGGDELLQGYAHFHSLPRLAAGWSRLSRIPGAMALASGAASLLEYGTGNSRWGHAPQLMRSLSGAWLLRRGLLSPESAARKSGHASRWDAAAVDGLARAVADSAGGVEGFERASLSLIESRTYLRNQLLRDSDWASMSHSVELRTPLVDAWLLREIAPLLGSLRDGHGKAMLCRTPARPIPAAIASRAKTGFGLPVGTWFGRGSDSAGMQQWGTIVCDYFDRLAADARG